MEILNILYSNNLIAVYLIGAILVVILIFIVISSIDTTPKDKKEILNDPIEEENKILESELPKEEKIETKEIPKINDIVEDLYQKSLENEQTEKTDINDLNSFLEEYDVPVSVIDEVINNEIDYNEPIIEESIDTNEMNVEKAEVINKNEKQENIEDMLKRLYDLRQNEHETRKQSLLNEIYELKKQIDETIKSDKVKYEIDYNYLDTKALADYYLFNEDIEFPRLK